LQWHSKTVRLETRLVLRRDVLFHFQKASKRTAFRSKAGGFFSFVSKAKTLMA